MLLLVHVAHTGTWTNPHSSGDPSSPEYLRLKEQREWKQSLHSVVRFPSSEKLKPALEQTGSKLECRSKLSLKWKNSSIFSLNLNKVTATQELVRTPTFCGFCTKHAYKHYNHKWLRVKKVMEKTSTCASPRLPPGLESGSRPNRSAGPRRLHRAHLHSAVCREGRGTERLAECVRSYCQRPTPANTRLKRS